MFRLCFCVSTVRMNLISHTWFLHIMYWFLSSSRARIQFLVLCLSHARFVVSFFRLSLVLCCLIFLFSAIKCRVSLCKYGFSKNSLAFNWYLSDEWILKDWLLRVVFLPLCQLSATKTISLRSVVRLLLYSLKTYFIDQHTHKHTQKKRITK